MLGAHGVDQSERPDMTTLFFYGTLRHIPLLEIVMNRTSAALELHDDSLPDHAVLAVAQGPFPMLVEQKGTQASGVVVHGLSAQDIARLNYYEAGFDYDLVSATTTNGHDVQVYKPAPGAWTPEGSWDLNQWTTKWGQMTEYAAREVMGYFGDVPAQEVLRRFPRIRARAWSNVNAQTSRHGVGTLRGKVEIDQRKRAYSNFFAIDEVRMRHETFDGGMSDWLDRAVFVSSDAAIVLPYDPVRDCVLLVEQIRLGPLGRSDPTVWQMEPVAGLIDPGETPQQAAYREAREESGLDLTTLMPAGECYASPGAASDFFYLFVGVCDLSDFDGRIGGAEAEGENIRSHVVRFETLLSWAEDQRTANAPLTLLTYWLAHHRAHLRADAGPVLG